MFEVTLRGERSDLEALFPGWNLHERFGVPMCRPFESLSANLLCALNGAAARTAS